MAESSVANDIIIAQTLLRELGGGKQPTKGSIHGPGIGVGGDHGDGGGHGGGFLSGMSCLISWREDHL